MDSKSANHPVSHGRSGLQDFPVEDTPIHWLIWLILSLFCLMALWAFLSKLDVVSLASGQVVPSSQVKKIQHLEGGIVSSIQVSEGQLVKRGQELIRLDPTRSKSELKELKLRIASYNVDITRLDAEAEGKDMPSFLPTLASDYPNLVAKSQGLFLARKARLESDLVVQRKHIEQRRLALDEVKARLARSRELHVHISEQITISNELLRKKLSNKMKHLELMQQEATAKGDVAVFEASLERVKSTIQESEAKLVAIRNTFQEEIRTERAQIAGKLQELSERIIKVEDSLARTILRAPVDGIVKTLFVFTEGGVIKPGNTVLEIVPSDDQLVIEARLAIQDIGFVEIGNEAYLQLASPDAQLFDKLIGKVTQISPDTLVSDKGIAFYKIRIETDQPYFQHGNERYNLYPGVQVQAGIITGERTVLDYILSPILRSTHMALRER